MSQLRQTINRAGAVLREEGPRELVARSREYLKRVSVTRRGLEVSYQTGTRVDFEDRWDVISSNVEPDDRSLLDIGCAEGELTSRFARNGLFSIGIERHAHTVATARARNGGPNVGFVEFEITPDTIESIPSTDVVLLLTVYHHWIAEFGWEPAEGMLRTLADNCETMFLEVPRRKPDRPPLDVETDRSIAEYYRAYLESVYDGRSSVDFLESTEYQGNERDDLIYKIDLGSAGGDR